MRWELQDRNIVEFKKLHKKQLCDNKLTRMRTIITITDAVNCHYCTTAAAILEHLLFTTPSSTAGHRVEHLIIKYSLLSNYTVSHKKLHPLFWQ